MLTRPVSFRPPKFTLVEIAQIKAVACEQPAKLESPLGQFSLSEALNWVVDRCRVGDQCQHPLEFLVNLPDKRAVKERILGFQERYKQTAKPFRCNFTRDDLPE